MIGTAARLTYLLVEDFVKRQLIPLLQVLLHHTANTGDTQEIWKRVKKKRKHNNNKEKNNLYEPKAVAHSQRTAAIPRGSSHCLLHLHPGSEPRFRTLPSTTCPLLISNCGEGRREGDTWEASREELHATPGEGVN